MWESRTPPNFLYQKPLIGISDQGLFLLRHVKKDEKWKMKKLLLWPEQRTDVWESAVAIAFPQEIYGASRVPAFEGKFVLLDSGT